MCPSNFGLRNINFGLRRGACAGVHGRGIGVPPSDLPKADLVHGTMEPVLTVVRHVLQCLTFVGAYMHHQIKCELGV